MENDRPWDLKSQMLEAIKENGGFVNCHAHFDKAYYITREGLDKSNLTMEAKWNLSDDIKKSSTQEQIEERIRRGLDMLIAQGCTICNKKRTQHCLQRQNKIDHNDATTRWTHR